MEPHALALQAMGAKRVAAATYYGDELNQAIVDYFARFDIETLIMGGFSLSGQGEGLYATPMMALDEVSATQVYQYCRRGLRRLGAAVDAIYINGGGWDAAPAVEPLERDLETRVVFALAAEMWLASWMLRIANPVAECGSLLQDGWEPVGVAR